MSVNILNRYTGAVLATVPALTGQAFAGLNLTNADLSNVNLSGSDFRGCNASGATFQNSNLSGTSFFRGNVFGADMRGITKNSTSNFLCCFFDQVLLDPNPNPVLITFDGGQSNKVGTQVGATTGLPDASIPFDLNVIAQVDTAGFTSLQINPADSTHGSEITYQQALRAAGYDTVEIKIAQGSTTMSDWVPGAANFTALEVSWNNAMSLLPAMYPGRYFRFLGNWYLGEDDARVSGGNGSSTYAANYKLFQGGLERLCSVSLWKRMQIVLTQSWLANAVPTALANVRLAEFELAGWNESVDDLAFQVDQVHLTAASEDILGMRRYTSALQQLALPWP